MRISARFFAVGAVLGLALVMTATANAYTITAQGALTTDSTFDASIDLTGTFGVVGTGAVYDSKKKAVTPFIVTGVGTAGDPAAPGAPTTPISLYAATPIHSTPVDLNAGADYTLTDLNLHTLADVQNLDVDLLNGQIGSFAINTLDIYTNSTVALIKDITIDLGGDLSGLTFAQTGAATLSPTGFGTGTFSIDGDLSATLSNLLVVAIGGLIPIPVDDQILNVPGFALTGNYTVTSIPGGRHIALDGSVDLEVPLGLVSALETSISDVVQLTISTTIDLAASVTVSVAYHLETNVVPEPGSFILLGIGLAALVPVLRLRRKS